MVMCRIIRSMVRMSVLLGLLGVAACSGSSSLHVAAADDGSVDSTATCVPYKGEYTCLGGTFPVCPTGAQPEQSCDNTVSPCMGCSQGAGFTCSCVDAGLVAQQDGSLWDCIGTEYSCQ
jgi:hypothetical protein